MNVEISRNEQSSRYEAHANGAVVGFAEYRDMGTVVAFPHTVVQPQFEGNGIAGRLAQLALDDAVAAGKKLSPVCSYFAGYIERHPEYAEHVEARGSSAT